MKPDPDFIFYNYYQHHQCKKLFHSNGKELKFSFLTKKTPPVGEYIFVIRELEPTRIYLHNNKDLYYKDINGKIQTVHHNCLALNRRVISAGSIQFINKSKSVVITNSSGHYFPTYESLSYLNYLLSNLGYNVIDTYEF